MSASKDSPLHTNLVGGIRGKLQWENMALPRQEGGVGLKDFYDLHQASIVERAGRVWDHEGIWEKWI